MPEQLYKQQGESLYEKNIAVFAKRHAAMQTHMESLDVSTYHVEQARDGDWTLRVDFAEGKFIHIGDSASPREEARRCLPQVPHPEKSLFVLMGMGLGHLLFEAVKGYPGARFVVLEHDARIFRRALELYDFTELFESPRVDFAVGLSRDLLPRYFLGLFSSQDTHLYLPKLAVLQNPAIVKHSRAYYQSAAESIKRVMDDFWFGYVGNDHRDALIGLDFVLKNLLCHEKFISIEAMKDQFKGRAGIVVSSGPSLDSKMELLQEMKDRAVIICADTALSRLLDHGIRPFGVASIERNVRSEALFRDIDLPEDLILFGPPLLKPGIFENYPGPICFIGSSCYPFHWMPRLAPLWEMGHSCAHLALRILDHMGCKTVALLGQDLAYDPQTGASHHAKALDFVSTGYGERQKFTVESNAGGKVQSNTPWLLFRNEFNTLIYLHIKARVLNVIENDFGARIEQAETVTPGDFRKLLATEPCLTHTAEADILLLREKFRLKWHEFLPEFRLAYDEALRHFSTFDDRLLALGTCKNFDEYFTQKNRLMQELGERGTYLFDDMAKPDLRRFEARAFSLLDERQFGQELPVFLDKLRQINAGLLCVLEENYDALFV